MTPRWATVTTVTWRVDWHFGQSAGFVAKSKRANAFRTALYLLTAVIGVTFLLSPMQSNTCQV